MNDVAELLHQSTRTERLVGNGTAPELPMLRSAAQIAAQPQTALWLIPGLLERNALLLMFGELGSLKSFLALHWALQIADSDHPVIYLHAEGRGLWRRLRAWAMRRYSNIPWSQTLQRLPFYAVERPLNLSADAVVESLRAAVTALKVVPALIVVDTMSRNSDGTVERSTEDATMYLNRLDGSLRVTYSCSILLVHHVGHSEKERARGPYVLMANTDCNYCVERPDRNKLEIVMKVGRMKDAEPPAPLRYVAEVVELDMFEDGRAATSLVLRPDGIAPATSKKPGKNQLAAVNGLSEWARSHADANAIGTSELTALLANQGLKSRNRRYEAIRYLIDVGVLTPSVGGYTVNRDAL